jgi:glycerol-3-phosphate dehydrogenase
MSAETEFSHRSRAAALQSMAAEPVDVLVIGGGITGAAIARDAALRGVRTALVDKGDFGGGTSSHSSRLIHGGLRYLEQRDFRLVLEASRERRVLLGIAPHLVRPLPFLFPVYRGARVPAWQLRAGMWLYDVLAAFRNVRMHRWLSRKAVLRVEPGLREKDLRGAGLYYDAQADDARLVLATMRSAAQAGALVANYAEVSGVLRPDGRVRGATVRDALTGTTLTVRALLVVNASGPWADEVRRLDDPRAQPLLRLTRGAHVSVPRQRLGNTHAVTLTSPIDGRVMFLLPWGAQSYIGTTDTDEHASPPPDDVDATAEDVIYLLRSANAFFPDARLAPQDVVATWAGLRTLLRPDRALSPSDVSREHRIVESPSGLLTIAGGKLTTHRAMARDMVDRVAARLAALDGRPKTAPPPTDRLPLPGGETADLDVLVDAARARGASEATARHLVMSYGSESAAVLNLVDRDRGLGGPIVPGRPELWAEVGHAVEREMAVRLADVLVRRLHLFYEDRGHGADAAPTVAAKMGELLNWDAVRVAEELAAYREQIERSRAFLAEIARPSKEVG